jgi:uncharacterized protein YjbJ (UPF0337 family)
LKSELKNGHNGVPQKLGRPEYPRRWTKMDKDRVKGTVDDAAGRVKRQVGEWTGDTNAQAEGAAQQVKGKVEKAWGNVKDAARDAKKEVQRDDDKNRTQEQQREDKQAAGGRR